MRPSERRQLIERHLGSVSPKQIRKGKNRTDNSAHFRLLGGPYHDNKILCFAPWTEIITFDNHVYQLHGPLIDDEWVYTYKGLKEPDEQQ